MEETSLQAVMSGQEEPDSAPEQVQHAEPTGEEVAAAPAEVQDDPMDRHRKGLEAAAVAERTKRQAAEARAQALEDRVRQFEAQQQAKPKDEGEPDPNDPRFQENPQAYWRELARHEARNEWKQRDEAAKAERQREEQDRAQAAFKSRVDAVVSEGKARYADFDAVVNAGLGPFLNPTMQQAIALGENGQDVAYWLGKNPAEAARLSQLPPMLMVLELGKLAAKASAPATSSLPRTLTTARDARGQFTPQFDGPTPLDELFARK